MKNIITPTKIHDLKVWTEFFEDIMARRKTFEVRKDDRNFQVDEFLSLQCFDPFNKKYTGEKMIVRITYKLNGGQFGIEPGYCVLGISEPEIIAVNLYRCF